MILSPNSNLLFELIDHNALCIFPIKLGEVDHKFLHNFVQTVILSILQNLSDRSSSFVNNKEHLIIYFIVKTKVPQQA
jgi:hypothetical protein